MGGSSGKTGHPISEHPMIKNFMMVDGPRGTAPLMTVRMQPGSSRSLTSWLEGLQLIVDRHTLFLPLDYSIKNIGLCNELYAVEARYPYFAYTLSEEIRHRHFKNEYFTEQELWYLLYQTCEASRQFQRIGGKAGDIRPENILINHEGQIKIFNVYSMISGMNNYQKALECGICTYLAPEELDQLDKGLTAQQTNPSVAQTFSIGLTVLDAALIQDCSKLYNMQSVCFRSNILKDMLKGWKKSRYSDLLINTVESMVMEADSRPTPGEIHAMLEPYGEKIRKMEVFQPDKKLSSQSLKRYRVGYGTTRQIQWHHPSKSSMREELPITSVSRYVYSPVHKHY